LCFSPGQEHNFDKYDANTITNFGVPYDYDSVMHYDAYAFSANGQPTITPLVSQLSIYSSYQLPGSPAGFVVLHKSHKIYQNKTIKRHAVRLQPVSTEAWVYLQDSLSGDYGG
jgi:hypothetical protein